ncbi:hypothetical protein L6164_000757 [Bauhinia variegata]|uniref:Uncharacterized protein n=1 Tax=Bauhinia variegata TaxID=167791 RepID=A0ACB9Q7R0_BAUVA|nr:hypothetical protein L6164_000757 [Bauhinia variegata]
MVATVSGLNEMEVLGMAQSQVIQARNWMESSVSFKEEHMGQGAVALRNCDRLYGESQFRLPQMLTKESTCTRDDARNWLSAVMTNHITCMDELKEKEYDQDVGRNLTTGHGHCF